MGTRPPQPTNVELQVLGVLWKQGPATAREVLQRMPDGKPRSYTTVLTIMQIMERKGLLKRRIQGRAHVYRPATGRDRIMRPMLRDLVAKAFGGNPAELVQQLLADKQVKAGQLDEMRALLNELGPTNADDPGNAS